MLIAKQYSAMTERKSKAYIECVISAISWVCVCVVGAVNDGNCSLRWSATVSVVQESMWWKGNQIRDNMYT